MIWKMIWKKKFYLIPFFFLLIILVFVIKYYHYYSSVNCHCFFTLSKLLKIKQKIKNFPYLEFLVTNSISKKILPYDIDVYYEKKFAVDKEYVIFNGKKGKRYDEIKSIIISPDGKKIAYVVRERNEEFVVANGFEGKKYDQVYSQFTYPYKRGESYYQISPNWRLVFSDNSQKLGYIAKVGPKFVVVVNDLHGKERESQQYDEILSRVFFTSNGQRFGFIARDGKKTFAVINGNEEQSYDYITLSSAQSYREGSPFNQFYRHFADKRFFTEDGKRYIYFGERNERFYLIINGKEVSSYEEVVFGIHNLFDLFYEGKYLNFQVFEKGKYFFVLENIRSNKPDFIKSSGYDYATGNFSISKDLNNFALNASVATQRKIIEKNSESKLYDEILWGPVFVFDNKIFYIANENDNVIAVLDGQEIWKSFDIIKDRFGLLHLNNPVKEVYFSQNKNKKRVAFIFEKKIGDSKFQQLIVDGKESGFFKSIDFFEFIDDGNQFIFSAKDLNGSAVAFVNWKTVRKLKNAKIIYFSPDWKRHVYLVEDKVGRFVVQNGEFGGKYKEINRISFNSDRGTLIYRAKKVNDKEVVVLNQKAGKDYDQIEDYSVDKYRNFHYVGYRDGKIFFVVNNKEIFQFCHEELSHSPVTFNDNDSVYMLIHQPYLLQNKINQEDKLSSKKLKLKDDVESLIFFKFYPD